MILKEPPVEKTPPLPLLLQQDGVMRHQLVVITSDGLNKPSDE